MMRGAVAVAVALALAGCGGGETPPERAGAPGETAAPAGGSLPVIAGPGEGLRAPVDVVPHSIVPRPVEQDYVEPLRPSETGPVCAILVQPRLRTPREGPWTITFVAPDGSPAVRLPPQSVDPVTGQITLVAHTPFFGLGEWTIELDLVEGGRTHGPDRQVFRFRVE